MSLDSRPLSLLKTGRESKALILKSEDLPVVQSEKLYEAIEADYLDDL